MSYLSFQQAGSSPSGKTLKWVVHNGGVSLGVVSWYASWRRYTFTPCAGTTFDASCLTEISTFLTRATMEHKNGV